MSEIVRPTRDGIHGREYISTSTDLGRTPKNLHFSDRKEMMDSPLNLIDIPLPVILRLPAFGSIGKKTLKGWAMAAERLGTLFALPEDMIKEDLESFGSNLIPIMPEDDRPGLSLKGSRLIEIPFSDEKTLDTVELSKDSALISVRVPLKSGIERRVCDLVADGVSIIHLEGDYHMRLLEAIARERREESSFSLVFR